MLDDNNHNGHTPESAENQKDGSSSNEGVSDYSAKETDDTLPAIESKSHDNFLVVGIGASAGGVEALQGFFEHLTLTEGKPGIAFVVVMHLSPEYHSNLAAIIQRHTVLNVVQVTERIKVIPNNVYVIPPAKQLAMSDGHIRLSDFEEPRSRRLPVDLFFRTLAQTHADGAAVIVLSGTGSDGVTGLPRIKEMGGLTLVQDPEEAQYDQMPKAAIATGFVDQVLPVTSMGNWLLNYAENRQKIDLHQPAATAEDYPDTAGTDVVQAETVDEPSPSTPTPVSYPITGQTDSLKEILALLWVRTGHNFALYKRPTLHRRLERRMQVNDIPDPDSYLAFLGTHPEEVQALLRDLLISVTNFFRDKEVWEYLAVNVIPAVLKDKDQPDNVVRVWVAGCATGEEAYSLAILLHEYASKMSRPPKIIVFASDLNEHAIAIAREGSYPETIELDVSQERLNRFFTKVNLRYRVKKEIRDTVLFAKHDLLKDPPFSRMDLVTCRNLLIYLNKEAQEQVLTLFHFALKPNAYLLLGTSETADSISQLFSTVNKKQHLYTRQPISPSFSQLQSRLLPVLLPRPAVSLEPKQQRNFQPEPDQNLNLSRIELPGGPLAKEKPGELHENILEFYAAPSLVVDHNYNIIHLSDRAGRYLRLSGGELSSNLLNLIHPDLRLELRAGLYRATHFNKSVETQRIKVNLEGTERFVRLTISAVRSPGSSVNYLLVVFDEFELENNIVSLEPGSGTDTQSSNGGGDEGDKSRYLTVDTVLANNAEDNDFRLGTNGWDNSSDKNSVLLFVRQLEEENEDLKRQLHSSIEQNEASVEEFRASHEEMQAVNEELRSATEELETSREELQAVNEELLTVNQELKINVEEVSHANSDLQNLMVSTDIATIFLNRHLHLKRFTPKVEQLFNIIPTDINRPLAHITHRLNYKELLTDLEGVLRNLAPVTREVKTIEGEWYLARLRPYRTLEDRIEGVVITFIDITERKMAEETTHAAHERVVDILRSINDGFYAVDPTWRLTYINTKAQEFWNRAGQKLVGMVLWDLFKPGYKATNDYKMHQQAAAERVPVTYETFSQELKLWLETTIYPSSDGGLSVYFRDITERKRREANSAFLASLTEDFATLSTPQDVMQAVGEKIYSYFGLSRLIFSDVDEAAGIVRAIYEKHEAQMVNSLDEQHLSEFVSEDYVADFKAGHVVVVNDARNDSSRAAGTYQTPEGEARLLAPFVSQGQLQFIISMQKNRPYQWLPDEIELLQELGPRLHLCLERTRSETALRQSQERLQRTIDIETVGITFFKPDGQITGTNAAFLRMSGYTYSDLESGLLRWDTTTPPEYLPASLHALDEFLTLGRTTPYEKECVRKDGSRWWALFAATRLNDEEGAEFIVDISQLKQGEKALKESEEQFRSIVDLIPDLLWSNDSQGITDWYNQRWYDFSGKTPEEALGYSWLEIVHPEDKARVQANFERILTTGEALRQEVRLCDAEGNYRWHLAQARPVLDAEGKIRRWFGASTDIHEERMAQEQLEERVRERTEELRQTNAVLQQERVRLEQLSMRLLQVQETERRHLARELHDEIGQYLTGLNFMLESLKLLSADARSDQLNKALTAVSELTLRVQELSLNLRPSVLDDMGLLAALIWYMQRFTSQTGIEVDFQHKGLEGRLATEVETSVYRVIQEALTNVARHSGVKEVRVRLLSVSGVSLTVLIEDEGAGFDVEGAFARPTSIGLSGMRERVELIGGELTIESSPGKGTTLVLEVALGNPYNLR